METALSYFISIGLWLDKIIYSGIGLVYELLMEIADFEIFSQGTIEEFSKRIYALLGIFMLFKLTFSLITYVVNPDEMADKTKGMASIGKNVIISLVMILLTPYIFAEAYNLQNIILNEHTLENLVFGTQSSSTNSTSRAGEILQFNLFSQFVRPNVEEIPDLKSCDIMYELGEDGNYKKEQFEGNDSVNHYVVNEACFSSLEGLFDETTYFLNYKQAFVEQKYGLLVNIPEVYKATHKIDNVEYPILNYQFLLSTVVGFVVLIVLLNFCLDIATRSIKLAFYQIISPIPIISMCDPKSSKSGMFSKWVKACFNTYLSLFIRLLALYLAIYIITAVVQDATFDGIASIFIIIGALIFAKELPKIITDLTGIKLDGKFTLNPFKKIQDEAIGGKRLGGAVGGFVAGFVGGRGIGSALTGFARGFGDGKGYESGLSKQADINRKLREARINGAGFWGSRVAALGSKYGLDDFDIEKRATTYEKNKAKFDAVSRNVEQEKNGRLVRKKEIQKNMADRNGTKASFDRFSSNAKSMETRAVEQIKDGAAGELSQKYLAKQAYYEKLKQHNGTAVIGAHGELRTFEQLNSEYGSYTIDANGNLFVKSKISGAPDLHVGKVIDDDMVSQADKDAKHYLSEVAKYDYMTRAIANANGENTYVSVEGDTRSTSDEGSDDKTFMSAYNNYMEALENLGEETEYETDQGFTRDVKKTGKQIHAQFGQSKGIINAIDRSMYADNDKIADIDNEIAKLEAETLTGISGLAYDEASGAFIMKNNLTYEEASKYLDREGKEITYIKNSRKANRDAAAASKINWNDK